MTCLQDGAKSTDWLAVFFGVGLFVSALVLVFFGFPFFLLFDFSPSLFGITIPRTEHEWLAYTTARFVCLGIVSIKLE